MTQKTKRIVLLVLSVLLVFTVLLATATCKSCSAGSDFDFRTHEDALECYQSFLGNIKEVKSTNTESFTNQLLEFKQTTDTIHRYLKKDSAFIKEPLVASRFIIIHDSIVSEFGRLAETWRYSYSDILSIKERTSTFHEDRELQEAVREAEPFFLGIDSIPTFDDDKRTLLARYRRLLRSNLEKGIGTRDEMLAFIRQEDVIFRSFLSHLYEMDDEPLADITKGTEEICRGIFISARNGKIPARDAMVYMSMRTVRRLLQNSAMCVSDINRQKMKSKEQGNAYLWMIIQPFISIDQFAIATLTPRQRSDFNYVTTQLPKSVQFARAFDIDQRSLSYLLPQQLLKMYVLSF